MCNDYIMICHSYGTMIRLICLPNATWFLPNFCLVSCDQTLLCAGHYCFQYKRLHSKQLHMRGFIHERLNAAVCHCIPLYIPWLNNKDVIPFTIRVDFNRSIDHKIITNLKYEDIFVPNQWYPNRVQLNIFLKLILFGSSICVFVRVRPLGYK